MLFFIFHQSGLRGNFPSLAHLVSRFVPSLTPNLFDKNHEGSISVIKNHAQANIFIAMVNKSKSFVDLVFMKTMFAGDLSLSKFSCFNFNLEI